MSFEHLPFSSFALESSAGPAPGFADGSTLTLDLATVEHPLLDTAMRGTVALVLVLDDAAPASLCASVVPVGGGAMTLTF